MCGIYTIIAKMEVLILNLVLLSIMRLNIAENIYPTDKARDALLKDILSNYHPSARPAHDNETIMLFLNIEMQHFDFNEKSGAFHLVGLLNVKWRDPKLVWNPTSYGNMSHILISQRRIWVPDLEFYNNAPDKFIRMHHNGLVSVRNDGVAFWSDYIELNIFCSADMTNWPYDQHECRIALGSWNSFGLEMNDMHSEANSSMTFSSIDMKNMKYKITKFNASHLKQYVSCCIHPFVTMNYDITFERQSSNVVIFRILALTIILFTLVALRMEPKRTEKLWLNGFSFILISCQLFYFARNIGNFHGTPNIVIFFSACLVMVTTAQLLAIFSLFATHSKSKGYIPDSIEKLLNSSFMGYLVRTDHKTIESEDNHPRFEEVKLGDTSNLIDRNLIKNDWLRLVKILNVVALTAFSFTYIILISVCYV